MEERGRQRGPGPELKLQGVVWRGHYDVQSCLPPTLHHAREAKANCPLHMFLAILSISLSKASSDLRTARP